MQAVVKSRNGSTAKLAAKDLGVPAYAVYKLRRAIDVLGQAEVDSLIFSGRSIAAIEQAGKDSRGKAKDAIDRGVDCGSGNPCHIGG